MICTQNKIYELVTIQFWMDFVKSGVVVKVFTNAYASTVYWQKSKFSSKHHLFSEFREYSVSASFFAQCSSIKNKNGGFLNEMYPKVKNADS